MNKTRVVNVEPFHAEVKINDSGFSIWFFTSTKNDSNNRIIYKVHFRAFWLRLLAGLLWKVQKHRASEAAKDAKVLRDE